LARNFVCHWSVRNCSHNALSTPLQILWLLLKPVSQIPNYGGQVLSLKTRSISDALAFSLSNFRQGSAACSAGFLADTCLVHFTVPHAKNSGSKQPQNRPGFCMEHQISSPSEGPATQALSRHKIGLQQKGRHLQDSQVRSRWYGISGSMKIRLCYFNSHHAHGVRKASASWLSWCQAP
jgi:hypothetical protein